METQNTENNTIDKNSENENSAAKEDLKMTENEKENIYSDEIYRKNIEKSIRNVYQELMRLEDQIKQLEKRQNTFDEFYSKMSCPKEISYSKEDPYHQIGRMAVHGLIIITVTLFYVCLEWLTTRINISGFIVGISGVLMLCTIMNQLFKEDLRKIRNLLLDDLYNDEKHLDL